MYASVISMKAKTGMLTTAVELAKKLVVPTAQRYAGFHHWCQLSDPVTNDMLYISLWGNEEDMDTFGQNDLQQIMAQMGQVVDLETLESKMYCVDVMAEAIPELIVDQIADGILESA